MEYRKLGQTGLRVSAIALGTMQFGWTTDEVTAHRLIERAVDLGCNLLDTADVYSRWADGNSGGVSEAIIGRWLAKGAVARDALVLATKVRAPMGDGPNEQGLSRKHIFTSVDASLQRLQSDYIDLYQVHWPDDDTPLEETLTALDDLVRVGKVRYVGCSNYPAWLVTKALWVSDRRGLARFDSLQPHYNFVHRAEFERALQPLALDQGLGVLPYSPLAGGFLSGKYRAGAPLPASARAARIKDHYLNERGLGAVEALAAVAAQRGASVAQTAVAWVLANPAVSAAIVGANQLAQLDELFGAVDVSLGAAEKANLDQATAW